MGSGEIVLAHRDGDPWVLLTGEIDMQVTDAFDGDLEAHLDDGNAWIDLSRVEFMDSSGLAVLLSAANWARAVHIVNAPTFVKRLILMTGVTSRFKVEDRPDS